MEIHNGSTLFSICRTGHKGCVDVPGRRAGRGVEEASYVPQSEKCPDTGHTPTEQHEPRPKEGPLRHAGHVGQTDTAKCQQGNHVHY